jgi:hypothetical protein
MLVDTTNLYSPDCREGRLSEARIPDRASLCDRAGAKRPFRPGRVPQIMHLATPLDRYAGATSCEDSWVMGQVRNCDMLTLQTCIPPTFEERFVVRTDRA